MEKKYSSLFYNRRSDVSSFPLGDRGNDTSGQGQALLRCDNDDGGGDDDDENSDVGNDFHCGSYDDIVLMFGAIWDDIKVTVKRCCTVVSVAGGQTTSSCLGQGCDIYPQVRSNP